MNSDLNSPIEAVHGFSPATGIGTINYLMLVVAVVAQLLTVVITWELWQVRTHPPHLPVFELNQISFGVWILATLIWMVIHPKSGFIAHIVVIGVASIFDQFRLQPQVLAIIFLMFATLSPFNQRVCRWFLAALWVWAGTHKLLSPHWFTFSSYWLVHDATESREIAEQFYWQFGLFVALAEIAAGLAATFFPRLGAFFCVAMHLTITILLVVIEWNYSVLPWNGGTIIVGTWVLWTVGQTVGDNRNDLAQRSLAKSRIAEFAIATIFFTAPVGFYYGLLDHGYASVLYSDYLPRGLITGQEYLEKIEGWEPTNVPFPCERRTLRQYFEAVASEGEKLHIMDPRESLSDLYFVFADGKAIEIPEEEFYSESEDALKGVGFDDRHALFWLSRWGKIKYRYYRDIESDSKHNAIAYAYSVFPEHYNPELLRLLPRLTNLEQLQLSGCPVSDDDLREIGKLTRLKGIGINNTPITDEGLLHLSSIPSLMILEIENTRISPAGMEQLKNRLGL